jgi:hypothetical protein
LRLLYKWSTRLGTVSRTSWSDWVGFSVVTSLLWF